MREQLKKARPFLKWAGGKTQLLPELLKRIPKGWNPETDRYHEPFLGGGALFWALQPRFALVNDLNCELMGTYTALQTNVEAVISGLRWHAAQYQSEPEKAYYQAREQLRATLDVLDPELAACFIFLNKTCFNGLYRVNKKGLFNVPWGRNLDVCICDADNLRACSKVLNACTRFAPSWSDFERLAWPSEGSLWYADPPYVPQSNAASFTSYTTQGFIYADQLRLLVYAAQLKAHGVHVLLSQAANEGLIDQYRRCGFTCDLVHARRAVNSEGSGRGPVGEYIIY